MLKATKDRIIKSFVDMVRANGSMTNEEIREYVKNMYQTDWYKNY